MTEKPKDFNKMDNPIQVPPIPKPTDRSTHKPIYLVVAEDPRIKGKIQHYRAIKVDRFEHTLSIIGYEVTKAQANELVKNPYATKVDGREINREIAYQKLVCIDNLTYKQKRKENKNDNA